MYNTYIYSIITCINPRKNEHIFGKSPASRLSARTFPSIARCRSPRLRSGRRRRALRDSVGAVAPRARRDQRLEMSSWGKGKWVAKYGYNIYWL